MSIEDQYFGYFLFSNHYRKEIPALLQQLKGHYRLSVLSGDNEAEKSTLQGLLGPKATLLFHQQPEDKLAPSKSAPNSTRCAKPATAS